MLNAYACSAVVARLFDKPEEVRNEKEDIFKLAAAVQ